MEDMTQDICTTNSRVLVDLDKFFEARDRKKQKRFKKVKDAVRMGMGANVFINGAN